MVAIQDKDTEINPEVARHQRKEAWRRRIPLLPALVFTIVVTQVPTILGIWYSLTEWNINTGKPRTFTGLKNYTKIFTDKFFFDAVWISVLIVVLVVLLSVVLGTLLSLLLDRKFFGQGLVRTLLITPFLVMPVVAGLVWKSSLYNATFGVLNWLLGLVGVEGIAYLSKFPVASIIAVLVWQWTPFMMLIILAGLQGQDSSILEAAKVDGANSRATFFQITLPHLRPYMELGVLLGSIYLIQVFDHIVVLTAGGSGSVNVPYFIYQKGIFGGFKFGEASAYSFVVVVASIIIATLGLRVLSGLIEGEEGA